MPFYRTVRSRSSTRHRREGVTVGFRWSDLFRSRTPRVVRIIEETPVHRRTQEYAEERHRSYSFSPPPNRRRGQESARVVHFQDESPSPPPRRRTRRMSDESPAEGFTPLPPIIKKSSSESDRDRGFDIEDRAPKKRSSKSYKKKPSHLRTDSKLDRQTEFIEVPSSPRLFRESDADRARRKAEQDAIDAAHVAAQNADVAYAERRRRVEVEDLGRSFERAYIDERDERLDAVREAHEAQAQAQDAVARADNLARELERERRDKRYLERKAELLAREKRVAEEAERITRTAAAAAAVAQQQAATAPILPLPIRRRPVELHQEHRPPPAAATRDPGADAIRRAQEDARRRQQHMREDDLLYGQQRSTRGRGRGRRVGGESLTVFDDDSLRRGHRRE